LGELGYRIGITGKLHAGPEEVFPFEELDILKNGTIDKEMFRNFAEREPNQPFALIIASSNPHRPWNRGNSEKFDPNTLILPPNLIDTHNFRKWYVRYLAEMEDLDRQVGQSLKALESTGEADNTMVIFTSEHGASFSGKWTNWNVGVQTAFVVRWPGVIAEGGRTDALIQYADVVPTLVEAAGGIVDDSSFDGTSFLPVLKGETDEHRQYAYFMHNHVPEGPPYPSRSVTDGEYLYIRNLKSDNLFIEKHVFGSTREDDFLPFWFNKATTDVHAQELIFRWMQRPDEELYQMERDIYNFENVAKNPRLSVIKQRLSNELDAWMESQNDPGEALDSWVVYKNNGGYVNE
ncbi:MAG: sulfatase-like hydrolase/transferase, partial [Cyclobacteriaceae bacterium]